MPSGIVLLCTWQSVWQDMHQLHKANGILLYSTKEVAQVGLKIRCYYFNPVFTGSRMNYLSYENEAAVLPSEHQCWECKIYGSGSITAGGNC